MNIRIFIFAVIFALILSALIAPARISAGELYTWIDEKGVATVSDTPPPEKPVKILGKETFRPDSPEEIERFRREIVERTGGARKAEDITDQELLREVMNTVGKGEHAVPRPGTPIC